VAAVTELGLGSLLAVPLLVQDRVLGAVTLVYNDQSKRRYGTADVPLVEELCRRAALALDNARLYREAQEAVRERERLIAALERSNRELDQFAYVTSHDLKAPLRGIGNLSEWIEEDLGATITPDSRKYLALLRERVHRLEALIDGILRYARAGRTPERPERFDAGKLIAETVELLAPPAAVVVTVGPGMPSLFAERVLLQQVFLNLIGNALKHARLADLRVEVRCESVDPFWQFSIADNGLGIAPEHHERIWGIFQRLEAPGKGEGSGIGLSVVKKIVAARGGRAWVESASGRGATFHFLWPKGELTA
jgi:signal transduction histidine kinase